MSDAAADDDRQTMTRFKTHVVWEKISLLHCFRCFTIEMI